MFEDGGDDLTGAAVRVLIEDVSRAGAASLLVGQWSESALPAGTTTAQTISFEIQVGSLDPRARYSLRAHVDVDRDGQTSLGDFITMETYPVSSDGPPFHRLRVRRV